MIKVNDLERKVLKEIVEGRTEYLFSRSPEGETTGLPTTLFHLKNFGYITATDISTKDGVGYTDVKLTEKAKEEL